MGLTVHFKLIAPPETDAARAHELVRAMRRRAQGFKRRGRVDDVLPIGDDEEALRWATQYKSIPHPWKPGYETGIEIRAKAGCLFPVAVGEDCEPLWLGLCRYPKTVLLEGRRYRTDLSGWRCHGFSKTQYASLHGWEHFRRCHTAVVDLQAGMRRLGLHVELNDEGGFWPGRSFTALRQNLDEMNGIVAAAAGALKDSDESANGQCRVQSPIFAHEHFEQLEAEGASRVGPVLKKFRAVLREP
ncbi:MAG TPA: hypothetical protein VFA77_11120 [Candidatus Eisenbacteria bacterium]|nr:hypothetical protein [Candidatus Eisenbacteria bacterium]